MKSRTIQAGFAIILALTLAACAGQVNGVPEPREATPGMVDAGRRLIAKYGCGACHTIPGVPGADAMVAPPLNRFYERTYISGQVPNTWNNLINYIETPEQIEPGTVMPDLGVNAEEARAIAAYLYHQPTLADWIRR
jgi:cytochrome c2